MADTYKIIYDVNTTDSVTKPSGYVNESSNISIGQNYTIQTVKPRRTGYDFIGWGISPASTAPSYSSGELYSERASITLYAVWQSNVLPPIISSLEASLCDSQGNFSESGPCIRLKFSWRASYDVVDWKISINRLSDNGSKTLEHETGDYCYGTSYNYVPHSSWKLIKGTTGSYDSVLPSATYGSATANNGSFSIPTSYKDYWREITVTIKDSKETYTSKSVKLSPSNYIIDILDQGKGLAVGMTASEEDVFDVGYKARFNKGIMPTVVEYNSDCDECIYPGTYVIKSLSTLAHAPEEGLAGTATLTVTEAGTGGQLHQVLETCDMYSSKKYERFKHQSAGLYQWGPWYKTSVIKHGIVYSSEKEVRVTSSGPIDGNEVFGTTIDLEPGVYIIIASAVLQTGVSNGTRNNQICIYSRNTGGTGWVSRRRSRVFAADKALCELTTTCIENFTSNTTIVCAKASSVAETTSENPGKIYLSAIRIA